MQRHKTGSLRFAIFITIFSTLFGLALLPCPKLASAQAGQGDEAAVNFRWAFGALVGSDQDKRLEAIQRDTSLSSGDQFKMLVELQDKCFIYLIHQNVQGELKLLFPYSLQQFAMDYEIGKKYYIPRGDAWLALDEQTGSETLHLLASAQRIEGIENLWSQYETAEAAHKSEIGKLILAEIRSVKKNNRELAAQAERPVAIGGNVRGVKQPLESPHFDVAALAEEVSAGSFYARAFTIDHR